MPSSRQRWTLLPLLVFWLASWCWSGTAAAQSPDVVRLFEEGLSAYREGRYDDAETLFARAHAIEPVADLTYNRARALENLGRFDEAADAYELFLTESPESDDRAGLEARVRTLRGRAEEERRLAEENAALREERDALAERETAPVGPAPAAEADAPWAPWLTLGIGALAAGGGGLLLGLAQLDYDAARAPDVTQADSFALESRSHDLAIAGFVVLGAGAVTAVVGLIWGLAAPSESAPVALGPRGFTLHF